MIGLLGKKVGMTQLFDDQGRQVPVTVLEVGPCQVTDLRTPDKGGYAAVQLGFGAAKEKGMTRAKLGHLKRSKSGPLRFIKEIRTVELEGLQVGSSVGVDNFAAGDFIDVEGVSIGKGFQGVVKRHHFKGSASKSHGSMFGRVPGSIGASSFPSRVVKGMRAAGHMGNEKITVHNVKVVKVDSENNLLVVKGPVPGVEGTFLVLRTALKRGTARKWKVRGQEESAKKEASQEANPSSPEAETKS